MGDSKLTLTDAERDLLVGLLEGALGDKRVEVRRTEFSKFRDQLVHEEDLLRGMLQKVRPEAS